MSAEPTVTTGTAPVVVRIPTILRGLTGGARSTTASGSTLADVLADLDERHPGIGERVLEDGALRRFVNVYVDDEDVRFTGGLATPVGEGAEVTILPAVAGGC
ncbi:MoaD/ThiS family protein [Aquipuribacter nitratireducens]|uniref:MoaD/ThiS family protein n=1 Tax=Aquipuribacter nitratireducens TaxID=650104 RepID=A0ABW0GNY6_9MICO